MPKMSRPEYTTIGTKDYAKVLNINGNVVKGKSNASKKPGRPRPGPSFNAPSAGRLQSETRDTHFWQLPSQQGGYQAPHTSAYGTPPAHPSQNVRDNGPRPAPPASNSQQPYSSAFIFQNPPYQAPSTIELRGAAGPAIPSQFSNQSSHNQPASNPSLWDFTAPVQPQATLDLVRNAAQAVTSNLSYGGSPELPLVSSFVATPPLYHPQETTQDDAAVVEAPGLEPGANMSVGTQSQALLEVRQSSAGRSSTRAHSHTSQEITLPMIVDYLKAKPIRGASDPSVRVEAEAAYIRDILSRMASTERFEREQCSYVSDILSQQMPRLYPLNQWGTLDRAANLEKDEEIEQILTGFKLADELGDEEAVKANIIAMIDIDEIGNALQAKLVRKGL
ncbi:hypothetical protein HWV62_23981 [Athelia sp. TMB]|nr:hypothetical protein HWV62_23981 [Athelia sp. TMB]